MRYKVQILFLFEKSFPNYKSNCLSSFLPIYWKEKIFYMNSNLVSKITILTHALVEVVENIREAYDGNLLHDLLSLKQLLMVSIILFYLSKWTTIVSEEQQTVGLKPLFARKSNLQYKEHWFRFSSHISWYTTGCCLRTTSAFNFY